MRLVSTVIVAPFATGNSTIFGDVSTTFLPFFGFLPNSISYRHHHLPRCHVYRSQLVPNLGSPLLPFSSNGHRRPCHACLHVLVSALPESTVCRLHQCPTLLVPVTIFVTQLVTFYFGSPVNQSGNAINCQTIDRYRSKTLTNL